MKITVNLNPAKPRALLLQGKYRVATYLTKRAERLTNPFFVIGVCSIDLGVSDEGPAMDALMKFADAVAQEAEVR